MKYELSKYGILARYQIEAIVEEVFMKEAKSRSYTQHWIDIFMELLPKKLCC